MIEYAHMTDRKKTRVMVVDDHPMVREGLAAMLSAAGFSVVASCESGEAALEALRKNHEVDVVLMDIRMPGGMDGFDTLLALKRECSGLNVILMAGMPLRVEVERAREIGARGYLPKTTKPRALADAIRTVVADRQIFVEEEYKEPESPLTAREMDVLRYLAEGKSREETGIILGISHETVSSHAKSIMFKLGCTTTAQAITTAFRQGILRA